MIRLSGTLSEPESQWPSSSRQLLRRRLVQIAAAESRAALTARITTDRPFVERLARVMAPGAMLHLATDWRPYAEQMLVVCGDSPDFGNAASGGGYAPRPSSRPLTRFERRGLGLGHEVYDLRFRRV